MYKQAEDQIVQKLLSGNHVQIYVAGIPGMMIRYNPFLQWDVVEGQCHVSIIDAKQVPVLMWRRRWINYDLAVSGWFPDNNYAVSEQEKDAGITHALTFQPMKKGCYKTPLTLKVQDGIAWVGWQDVGRWDSNFCALRNCDDALKGAGYKAAESLNDGEQVLLLSEWYGC